MEDHIQTLFMSSLIPSWKKGGTTCNKFLSTVNPKLAQHKVMLQLVLYNLYSDMQQIHYRKTSKWQLVKYSQNKTPKFTPIHHLVINLLRVWHTVTMLCKRTELPKELHPTWTGFAMWIAEGCPTLRDRSFFLWFCVYKTASTQFCWYPSFYTISFLAEYLLSLSFQETSKDMGKGKSTWGCSQIQGYA